MALYEYRCPECGHTAVSLERGNRLNVTCPQCACTEPFKRVWSWANKPMMHEHYNNTVGRTISDMRQFRNELHRKSEEATARTGVEHNYQPVDAGDAAAVGATNEGIEESNRIRSKIGAPLLPEIK